MKQKTNTPAISTRSFRKALAAGILATGLSTFAAAQTANPGEAHIGYAGTVDNKLVFEVQYGNKAAAPFTLDITDGEGYRFYNDKFYQQGFRRYFAIAKEELDRGTITIQVITKDGVQKQSFDINTNARFVEEVSVVKR